MSEFCDSVSSYSPNPLTPGWQAEHLLTAACTGCLWMSTENEALLLFPSPPSLPLHSEDENRPLSCCPVRQSSASLTELCAEAEVVNERQGAPMRCNAGLLSLASYQNRQLGYRYRLPSLSESLSVFQSWRMMKMTSPTPGQMESFCTITTAAKKSVSNAEFYK